MSVNGTPCQACGLWICLDCGWRRQKANRHSKSMMDCFKCGSINGKWIPMVHRSQRIREEHAAFAANHKIA